MIKHLEDWQLDACLAAALIGMDLSDSSSFRHIMNCSDCFALFNAKWTAITAEAEASQDPKACLILRIDELIEPAEKRAALSNSISQPLLAA